MSNCSSCYCLNYSLFLCWRLLIIVNTFPHFLFSDFLTQRKYADEGVARVEGKRDVLPVEWNQINHDCYENENRGQKKRENHPNVALKSSENKLWFRTLRLFCLTLEVPTIRNTDVKTLRL